MGDVIPIMKKRCFTLDEARAILPAIKRLTVDAAESFEDIQDDIDMGLLDEEEAESHLNHVIDQWTEQMTNLGCEPKGLWLVDFDNGQGYFCWELGEEDIDHFHTYDGDYETRSSIN